MLKKIFDREIAKCRKLSRKNGGKCKWGECKKCGVIPLLFKLGKGEIYEKKDEIKKIKHIVL